MYYEKLSSPTEADGGYVVDLRSDTLTKPTRAMREAMFAAEVGDDVYGEDPTVKQLEDESARLVGMEAAIFVTSGTMGNLIAVMSHCNDRGSEAYCGEESHVLLHEQCGSSQIAGVNLRPLANNPDGSYDIRELHSKLRKDRHHEPISRLVLVENTLNGKIVPRTWISELATFCREHDLKLHLDGARLFNASVGSGKTPAELAEGFDSVTFCLSKALGAPVGSMLCGSRTFVDGATRIRKVLGGGMRQVGFLAAAGLVALRDTVPILKVDHQNAKFLARSINDVESKIFSVDLESVQTNMVFVKVHGDRVTGVDLSRRLRVRKNDENTVVKCLPIGNLVRFVLHYDISKELLDMAVKKIVDVIREFDANL